MSEADRETRTRIPLVLCVDDEPAIRQLVRDTLELGGYRTATASDGDTALQIVEEAHPDAVLLDVRMPQKSGIEVLRELRERRCDVAVVMVTAVRDATIAMQAVKLGAHDYLVKPFRIGELLSTVGGALVKVAEERVERARRGRLEQALAEQAQVLDQRQRELAALNRLVQAHLNQEFDLQAPAHGDTPSALVDSGSQANGRATTPRILPVLSPSCPPTPDYGRGVLGSTGGAF